jgi:hypothetical protein
MVVWERDYTEGEEVEAELAFFAQDNYGNVWHMGEYPEEYENGEFEKAPGWLAGFKGAKAGIAMRAQPRLKTPSYAQGYAPPPINWVDRGRVYKVGKNSCVPIDCYDEVLVIEEFERNKPGGLRKRRKRAWSWSRTCAWARKEWPMPARRRSNWRSTPTRSRITIGRHSQRSPHFERRQPLLKWSRSEDRRSP